MGRATGARNDDLQAAFIGRRYVIIEQIRSSVSRDDATLVRNRQLIERLCGVAQCLPIGFRAHYDADERLHLGRFQRQKSVPGLLSDYHRCASRTPSNSLESPVPTTPTSHKVVAIGSLPVIICGTLAGGCPK